MDDSSEHPVHELHHTVLTGPMDGASAVDHSDLPAACVMCQRTISHDGESIHIEAISLCGDCKFLLLEEYDGTHTSDAHRRTPNRVRRRRHGSSESVENFFSEQFPQMISPSTQSQPLPRSRTTLGGSRRWRRVLSDTESDGFDSVYQESESNFSLSGHRPFQFESDAVSFSAYGGDSDASVDGQSVLDSDMFNRPDAGSDPNSDTDIDPMRAGPNQWFSDDQEEENEDEEDNEWEEQGNNRSPLAWQVQLHSPEFDGVVSVRIREGRRRMQTPNEPEVPPFVGFSGDYLDARGFNELLERLAEADNSRQGAPPAAVSFVNSLPRLVINEGHLEHDSLSCAICKDSLSVGCVVNQLPCLHLYHPSCILPWLRARNSCPLCRYELPTDDKDYEEGKRGNAEDSNGDEEDSISSSDQIDDVEVAAYVNDYHPNEEDNAGRSGRGRWLFLAAAPIMSLMGIAIMMWLKNSRGPMRGPHSSLVSGSWAPNQRENRRRWWSLF